tara:strand:- start:427 stop:1023 length:597 start_codon:yes stop_codon:yes gene_type:complete
MAIGFTVTGITDKKVVPDKTLTKQSAPKVRIQKFGDGYEQRIVDGINNIAESYMLTFTNRAKAEADDIIAFFDTNAGVTAFDFIVPDTNSTTTTTAVVDGSISSSKNVTLSATNLEIAGGAVVSYSTSPPISGTPTVASINGTALVLSTTQNISDTTVLTFVNQNERTIKVICEDWSVSFTNNEFHNIQTTFRRVYEP